MGFRFSFLSSFNFLKPTLNKAKLAKIILKEPTCRGESPTSDFFIKIKELPQTKERMII